MGKATGFLEYERKNNGDIPVQERVQNFKEFHTPLLYELWRAAVSVRYETLRYGDRMSAAQSDPGVE